MDSQFVADRPVGVGEWECPGLRGPVQKGWGKEARGHEEVAMEPDSKTPRVPRTGSLCFQITSLQQEGEELSGQARCPFDATQSNVAVFAGENRGMWLEGAPALALLPVWASPGLLNGKG